MQLLWIHAYFLTVIPVTVLNAEYSDTKLLSQFNRRDPIAFNEIYKRYYNELTNFAGRLFYNTEICVDDVIQDVFITIWEGQSRQFDTLGGIKAYIYVCIKNKLKNYIAHNKHVDEYNRNMLNDDCFVIQVAESEMLSILSHAIDLLPEECSKVFQLHLEGWEVQEIALKLNKSESTVYKQRSRAMEILKKQLYHQMTLLVGLMN